MLRLEERLQASVIALTDGEPNRARVILEELVLDLPQLERVRTEAIRQVWGSGSNVKKPPRPKQRAVRERVKTADIRLIFSRDKYTCRYSHCQRRTIYIPVLRAFSTLFPDLLPYNRNWRPVTAHVLYWMWGTSIEHKVSFPFGGTSRAENLLTTCYQCNDLKNYLPFEDLGWSIAEPTTEDWDGLSGYVPILRKIVGG